jgi:hypothetical protein
MKINAFPKLIQTLPCLAFKLTFMKIFTAKSNFSEVKDVECIFYFSTAGAFFFCILFGFLAKEVLEAVLLFFFAFLAFLAIEDCYSSSILVSASYSSSPLLEDSAICIIVSRQDYWMAMGRLQGH